MPDPARLRRVRSTIPAPRGKFAGHATTRSHVLGILVQQLRASSTIATTRPLARRWWIVRCSRRVITNPHQRKHARWFEALGCGSPRSDASSPTGRSLSDTSFGIRRRVRSPRTRKYLAIRSDSTGDDHPTSVLQRRKAVTENEVAESVIVESYEHQPDRRAGLRQLAYSLVAEKCLTILSAYHCGHGVSGFAAS